MKFKIEKKIPIPASRGKWPFAEMAVGDSILVPFELKEGARQAAFAYGAKKNMKFITRAAEEGSLRIWRAA